MFVAALDKALKRCRDAVIRLAWRQWSVLGAQVGGRYAAPSAVVDPEALLLLSCALRDDEPRLWDFAGGLASTGCALLSVQRTRNVASAFPEPVKVILAEVASIASTVGKDARWRPLAASNYRPFREGKLTDPTRSVAEPAALISRLRLAFGVHARTDALAFLIVTSPAAATAKEVAAATCYGEMPIRRGLDAIAKSRLITADGARPEQYHTDGARWAQLLDLPDSLPSWRHWHALFAFMAHAFALPASTERAQTDYLASSRARRIVMAHWHAFVRNRITVPEPSDYPGEKYLGGYGETLTTIATWLDEHG